MGLQVAFIVAVGTEPTECIATMDVLKRAGIACDVFGDFYAFKYVARESIGSYSGLDNKKYDAFVLPGGGLGVKNVKDECAKDAAFRNVIIEMAKMNKLVAAICAAPSIIGELGLLKGKRYTCYPGFSSDSFEGKYTAEEVVIDGNIITGRSMYYSVDFGLAIVEYLLGKEKRNEIEIQVKGLKPKS